MDFAGMNLSQNIVLFVPLLFVALQLATDGYKQKNLRRTAFFSFGLMIIYYVAFFFIDKHGMFFSMAYAVAGLSVMAGRICFQLIDQEQKHRGYIGFDFAGKKKAKWFVPSGTKTGDMLYNYYRRNGTNACILVEDPLRAAYLFSIGFSFTVSLLNSVITPEQKKLLSVFRYVTIIGEHMQGSALGLVSNGFVRLIEKDPLKLEAEDIKSLF